MKNYILLLLILIGLHQLSYGQKDRSMILPERTRAVKLNSYDVLKDSSNVNVFVKVLVSPNGKVQQAIVDLERSTTDDAELIGISLKSAYEALFDPSYTTNNQWGSISFTYRLGSMTNHQAKMKADEEPFLDKANGLWQSMKDDAAKLWVDGLNWVFIHDAQGKVDEIEYTLIESESEDSKVVLKSGRKNVEIFEILGLNDTYLSLLHQETGAINNYKKSAETK